MQGNTNQLRKDAEEIWRYRLSMDEQLTVPPGADGLRRYLIRYRDWYEKKQLREGVERCLTIRST